jgi:hypothetical protein
MVVIGQNLPDRFWQRFYRNIRWYWLLFGEAVIDEKALAPGSLPCRDVPPSVTDHVTARQIDIQIAGRIDQKAGFRLAAFTAISIDVRANPDAVEREFRHQSSMHFVERF